VSPRRTTVYYLVGQNSLLFNIINLTSPVLIIVAVKMRAETVALVPDRDRWFLFIAGDVVSYYVLFHDVFRSCSRSTRVQPDRDVPFPGRRTRCTAVSLPHHGLALAITRAIGAGPHQSLDSPWWRRCGHRVVGAVDLAVHPSPT
jgi:hypothetical protein